MDMPAYTPFEAMIVAAARELRDGEICFVGIGASSLAAVLAKLSHAPNLVLVYESGAIDALPAEPPLSTGSPSVVEGAAQLSTCLDIFGLLQLGRIDVGMISGAQIDRYGNVNSTVIGPYDRPKLRMVGSGGANDIACLARRYLIVVEHEKRRFPERVDYVTSPGYLRGLARRVEAGFPGGGPSAMVTTLGLFRFDANGELFLEACQPGTSVEEVRASVGWDLQVAEDVYALPPPEPELIGVLRGKVDPKGIFLSGKFR